METFKQRMTRLRKRAGYKSQQEAADQIGCERGTVGMWEAPSSAVESVGAYLLETARAYKVRPDYLNSGQGDDGYPWTPNVEMPASVKESSPPSQPGRLDPQILAQAVTALRELVEVRSEGREKLEVKDLEANGTLLALAYSFVAGGHQNDASGENASKVVLFTRYLRAQEGEASELRSENVGVGRRSFDRREAG